MKYKVKREDFKKTVWPWKKGDPISKVISIANALAKEGELTPAGIKDVNSFMPKGKVEVTLNLDGTGITINILTPLEEQEGARRS